MRETNRERKQEIKYNVQLNDEQRDAKRLIRENQIVLITGRAGSGKSLVAAQTALDYLNKKEIDQILVTRATVEVGDSLGFLPGGVGDKMNPYLEAFVDNLNTCMDRLKIAEFIKDDKIKGCPVQYIRGKTINDILVIEEAQNLTRTQMLALLTRLGKTGKIIINGDNEQMDINTHGELNGLSYVIELSKRLDEIKHIKLKENHRSDLVGKILDYEHSKTNKIE